MDGSRELHVTFVSNLNGSYPLDTVLATLPAPLSVALTSVVLTFLLPARYVLLQYSSRLWIHLLIESMTVVCPLLLSFTVLSQSTAYNPIILLVTIAGLMMCAFKRWTSNIPLTKHLFSLPLSEKRPPFLTNYRAGMNLATAICILAVDFPIFPRRFAKTETYGYSLMDVGVGSFVIAHGLIGSGQIRTARTLSRTLPIAILGFVRLIAVKMTNYHEHVTEYGVHWNFFFTLAFVKIASSLIVTNTRPIIISLGYLSVYQIGLKLGLESWILSEYPRHDLISANREGIFSLFGYMALFYAACELGDYINKPKQQFRDWFRLLLVLVSLSILTWFSLPLSESLFGMPSRRLVNATFCLWMFTYNLIIMAGYLSVDLLLVALETRRNADIQDPCLPFFREPYLMRFINYNGLVFFLAANLMTGLVNMSLDTIHTNALASFVIVLVYCASLCLFVAAMYLWRTRV